MHATNSEFVPLQPLLEQLGNGSLLAHTRPAGTAGPSFHALTTGKSVSPSACGMHGFSSITGGEIVIERTQGAPPQSLPSARALLLVHDPSHPTGGSKFVMTPPAPGQISELTVQVVGRRHAPSGLSHEHAGHECSGGAGVPSKSRIGASSGQGGGFRGQFMKNDTCFQASGAGGTHVPLAQKPNDPPSLLASVPPSRSERQTGSTL